MNLSCSSRMIKYLMFAFNLFFVISGIIIIAVGATVKTIYSDYADFLDSKYFSLPNMLIATGAFIFLVSFFGCCGAIKESWVMLGVFSIFLCIIFVFEFSAGIAGYVLRDKTIDYLDTTLRNNINNYANSSHFIWDSIQSTFHCCGVDSYTDWNSTLPDPYALPISCCPAKSGTSGVFYCNSYNNITTLKYDVEATEAPARMAALIGKSLREGTDVTPDNATTPDTNTTTPDTNTTTPVTNTTTPVTNTTTPVTNTTTPVTNTTTPVTNPTTPVTNATTPLTTPTPSTTGPYTTGCKSAFGDYIKKHAVQIGGWALGLAIVQILGIAFSCHLVRQLKNGYYST